MTPRTRTVFAVPKMDCPSEERLIRLALDGAEGLEGLDFDLAGRRLAVVHVGDPAALLARLEPLGFGARLASSEPAPLAAAPDAPGDDAAEGRVLRTLLALNAGMFAVELVAGWLARSTGLLADALDMLADALVYGVALRAVGKDAAAKRRSARAAGALQGALALLVLGDVARRAVVGRLPEAPAMIGVSLLALAVNVACVGLLARHREGGVHMKASYLFSTNDVLANLGVMLAGALCAFTGSRVPDLVIGTLVACLVLVGAARILRLR